MTSFKSLIRATEAWSAAEGSETCLHDFHSSMALKTNLSWSKVHSSSDIKAPKIRPIFQKLILLEMEWNKKIRTCVPRNISGIPLSEECVITSVSGEVG